MLKLFINWHTAFKRLPNPDLGDKNASIQHFLLCGKQYPDGIGNGFLSSGCKSKFETVGYSRKIAWAAARPGNKPLTGLLLGRWRTSFISIKFWAANE